VTLLRQIWKLLFLPFKWILIVLKNLFGLSRDTLDKVKIWVEVIAIVGASALAIWKFVYQDFLVPRSYQPSVKVTCKLEQVAITDTTVVIRLNYKIKNDSKRRKFILISRYQIIGQSYSRGNIFDTRQKDFQEVNTEVESFRAMPVDHVGQHYDLEYGMTRYEGIACGTFQTRSRLEEDTEIEGGVTIILANRHDIVGAELDVSYSDKELPENTELRLFVTDACKFVGYLNHKTTRKNAKRMFEESKILQEKYNLTGTANFDDIYIQQEK
jgi:hypothetical protein